MTETTFKLAERAIERLPQSEREALPALNAGRLHEIHARWEDRASALAFALSRGGSTPEQAPEGSVVLVRMTRAPLRTVPDGHGLAMLGMRPSRLLLVDAANELDLLRAGLEAARCPAVQMVLLETQGAFAKYDLTASRRLALAAEQSRNRVVVLRQDAEPRSSAAQTRWEIASAPSVPLEADAPGWPAIEAKLLRWRGGAAGRSWRLEWNWEHGTFRDTNENTGEVAPVSGAVVPLFRLRESADGGGPDYPHAA